MSEMNKVHLARGVFMDTVRSYLVEAGREGQVVGQDLVEKALCVGYAAMTEVLPADELSFSVEFHYPKRVVFRAYSAVVPPQVNPPCPMCGGALVRDRPQSGRGLMCNVCTGSVVFEVAPKTVYQLADNLLFAVAVDLAPAPRGGIN